MFISDGNKATSKLIKRSSIRRAKRNSINEYKIPKFTDRLRGVEPTDEQQILKSSLDLWGKSLKDLSNVPNHDDKPYNKYLPIKL